MKKVIKYLVIILVIFSLFSLSWFDHIKQKNQKKEIQQLKCKIQQLECQIKAQENELELVLE